MGDTTVDMTTTHELLAQIERLAERVDGADPDTEMGDNRRKKHAAERAEVARELLYMQHVSRQLTLELEHQWFRYKGTLPTT